MKRTVSDLTTKEYDLLIVGGGIYGAVAAWEATSRGLSVALIDKADFGGEMSAESQRIIHGGLRYFQHGDLRRVRSSIKERSVWMRIAPHLVKPLKCVMPVFGKGLRGRAGVKTALKLHNRMGRKRNAGIEADSRKIPSNRFMTNGEYSQTVGAVSEGQTGAAVWYDGEIIEPERLTLAFIKTAVFWGAVAVNYVEATNLIMDNRRVTGVEAHDQITGKKLKVRARCVLNSTGPWVQDLLISLGYITRRPRVKYAQAVNLVFNRRLTPGFALAAPSTAPERTGKRYYFATTHRTGSIVGTDYSKYSDRPERREVSAEDLDRFLADLKAAYPTLNLQRSDISYANTGLLPASNSRSDCSKGEVDRNDQIWDHKKTDNIEGLLSVVGVKYTTARAVVEKVIDRVFGKIGMKVSASRSAVTPLIGADIQNIDEYLESERARRAWGMSRDQIERLIERHGSLYMEVLHLIAHDYAWGEAIPGSKSVTKADIVYAVRDEMAVKLADVVFRRTGLGTMGYPSDDALQVCAEVMGDELLWDSERKRREVNEVKALYEKRGIMIPEQVPAAEKIMEGVGA
ncbi:MAG: glycerol-3-phosphate dehydrogenase/oxidase [Candidatus Omnitrophota bacterium]|nr:glycerol-3-phosphate dehydrogenase/oxidase [Candidatus Omnitrophota bacterium]